MSVVGLELMRRMMVGQLKLNRLHEAQFRMLCYACEFSLLSESESRK